MKRAAVAGLTFAAAALAASGGYWAGVHGIELRGALQFFETGSGLKADEPTPSGPVIYYRDPDSRAIYSLTPRQTEDGRDFRAVHASEELLPKSQSSAVGANVDPSASPQILYYRNPMGLPDISSVPKKDSMGMDYIPVYADEDGGDDPAIIKVSLEKMQRTGVRSEAAQMRPIIRPVRVPGTIQFDERRIAIVATRSEAFVEEVADVTTGDRVKKGQALIRLYSPEITAAGAQFLTNLNLGKHGGMGGGPRQRLENLGVPSDLIAEIERTRKVPYSIIWRAPRDGVVLDRTVVDGMKVEAGDVLFRLAETSSVWVLADVPEYELGLVEPGAAARVQVRSLPGQSFDGRVDVIYPQVAMETRTTRVRIEIPNPNGDLLVDMYADVEIETGSTTPVLVVSDSAVIDTGTRQFVIVDRGEGRFEPRAVRLGRRGLDLIEVLEGIDESDRVVVAANFLIDAESNLKAALRALTTGESQQ